MKTHTLCALLLVGSLGGMAWAQDPDCSVEVGPVEINMTDPFSGAANANASCVVVTNFAAIITPTVEAEAGFKNPANNHWVWSATIDGKASKKLAPNEESVAPITVGLSGVTLSDPVLTTPTKVATLTVTITEDESKSFLRPKSIQKPAKIASRAVRRPVPVPVARKR